MTPEARNLLSYSLLLHCRYSKNNAGFPAFSVLYKLIWIILSVNIGFLLVTQLPGLKASIDPDFLN